MNDFKGKLAKGVLILSILFLVCLAFWNKPNQIALEFISGILEEAASSLLLLTELKIGAASGASTSIPLVSGSFSGIEDILGQGLMYLEWSNLLLTLQLIALTLSKSLIIKVLMLVSIVFVFLEKSRILAFRLLIVFLLINPGLSIYAIGVKLINQETKIELGTNLNEQLKKSHTDYLAKRKEHQSKLEKQKTQQLAKAQSKGKDKISIFNRVVDKVEGTVYKVEDDVSLAFRDMLDVLKAAGKEIISLCINLFTHVLFLFLILPFGYYLLMKYVLADFITQLKTTNNEQTKSS